MKKTAWVISTSALFVGLTLGSIGSKNGGPLFNLMAQAETTQRPQPGQSETTPVTLELTPEELINVRVYERANRSVVNISTRVRTEDPFFFVPEEQEGSGSGFVWDKQGHVITNNHVIEEAVRSGNIMVTMNDGSSYPAELIGRDPPNDLAVLKISAPPESLLPLELGDSSNLKVGLKVFVIGNPFGLSRTMTTGIISSLNRTLPVGNVRTIKGVIQTDAAINPGNSGGPLLDKRGRLIGVNTAIISPVKQNSGIGFSIPANNLKRVVPQLIKYRQVIRADIGIVAVYETDEGLLINKMTRGGAAVEAGLRGPRLEVRRRGFYEYRYADPTKADRIITIDGREMSTFEGMLDYVESKKPGDTVKVVFEREDSLYETTVRLTKS